MNHDILKRLGLDHLDVSSPDFLETLNRLQQEARANVRRNEELRATVRSSVALDEPLPGLE